MIAKLVQWLNSTTAPELSKKSVGSHEKQLPIPFTPSGFAIKYTIILNMSKIEDSAPTETNFSFIQTPAAPAQTPPATDCGVRTTTVSKSSDSVNKRQADIHDNSTLRSRMLPFLQMPRAMTPSRTSCSSACSPSFPSTSRGS